MKNKMSRHRSVKANGDDQHPSIICFEPVTPTIIAAADEKTLPTFSMVAYTGGSMQIVGFYTPIVVDLAGMKLERQSMPVRLQHDARMGIGHTTKIDLMVNRITAEGVISRANSWARDVSASGAAGFPWQASIGANILRLEEVRLGGTAQANGKTFKGPLLIARQSVLKEISFVDSAADNKTSVKVAAQQKETEMKYAEWLKSKGFDLEALSAEQNKYLQAQYDEEQAPPSAPSVPPASPKAPEVPLEVKPLTASAREDLNTYIEEQKRIRERNDAISTVARNTIRDQPDSLEFVQRLSAAAIEDGLSPQEFELQLLRGLRPQAKAHRPRRDEELNGDVVQAAVCMAGGLDDVEKSFPEQVLDQAHKQWPHGLGLQELILRAARQNGYSGITLSSLRPALQAAFASAPMHIQAAFSTMSLSGILGATANKFLKAGFDAVESGWRQIAATKPVKDFKAVTSYALTGGFEYEEVGPDGELHHATVGETSYTNQVGTYGKMFSITRKDIINDDLGALTAVPRKLGRGAALKINTVFWTVFLNNSTFFTSARGNYAAGAATALGIDALTAAELLFLNQTDTDGKPLGVIPKLLLVPNALNAVAAQLMASLEIRNTTSSTKYPVQNPHAGKFDVVRSSYLSNSSITGYSAAAWYLLADPNDMPVVEVAFLNGKEEPTVESTDADFNALGVQMRGYHDFGVAKQEYRGGVKMLGEAE